MNHYSLFHFVKTNFAHAQKGRELHPMPIYELNTGLCKSEGYAMMRIVQLLDRVIQNF